jgi:hypothetical protein
MRDRDLDHVFRHIERCGRYKLRLRMIVLGVVRRPRGSSALVSGKRFNGEGIRKALLGVLGTWKAREVRQAVRGVVT